MINISVPGAFVAQGTEDSYMKGCTFFCVYPFGIAKGERDMGDLTNTENIKYKKYDMNFACVFSDSNLFSETEYKVLQSQWDTGLMKCMKIKVNGQDELFYITKGYKNLESLLPNLSPDSFILIIKGLIENIKNIKDNGFLSFRNIELSPDKIYVDTSTYSVFLTYIPANFHIFYDDITFENQLKACIIKMLSDNPHLEAPDTIKLGKTLHDARLNIESLYNELNGKNRNYKNAYKEELNRSERAACIKSLNISPEVFIEITKPEFVIGKKASAVDGCISFNKMISRVHCKIIKQNNKYYIQDLGSANGTFVNGKRIIVNDMEQISSGDTIRFANSDFLFMEG